MCDEIEITPEMRKKIEELFKAWLQLPDRVKGEEMDAWADAINAIITEDKHAEDARDDKG